MIAKRFLFYMMDVKAFKNAQLKKMKRFTINLDKMLAQMKSLTNMDLTFLI